MVERFPVVSGTRKAANNLVRHRANLRGYRGDEDIANVVELFNRCARENSHDHVICEEEFRADLARPEIDASTNVKLFDADGCCVGFAALLVYTRQSQIDIGVWMQSLPDADGGVEIELLEWTVARADQLSKLARLPVEILVVVGEHRPERVAALKTVGFDVARQFVELRCALDTNAKVLRSPGDYFIRPIAIEDEMPSWVAAVNEAFAGEWRFRDLTVDQAIHFARHDPCYRAPGDLIAIGPDGGIAGFCQCVIRSNENLVSGRTDGRIALLGVCPSHRRRGLGASLLQTGMRWLRSERMTHAMLGTDAESLGAALSLYQSVGFETIHRRTAFIRRANFPAMQLVTDVS